jgi:hypothetical protein
MRLLRCPGLADTFARLVWLVLKTARQDVCDTTWIVHSTRSCATGPTSCNESEQASTLSDAWCPGCKHACSLPTCICVSTQEISAGDFFGNLAISAAKRATAESAAEPSASVDKAVKELVASVFGAAVDASLVKATADEPSAHVADTLHQGQATFGARAADDIVGNPFSPTWVIYLSSRRSYTAPQFHIPKLLLAAAMLEGACPAGIAAAHICMLAMKLEKVHARTFRKSLHS